MRLRGRAGNSAVVLRHPGADGALEIGVMHRPGGGCEEEVRGALESVARLDSSGNCQARDEVAGRQRALVTGRPPALREIELPELLRRLDRLHAEPISLAPQSRIPVP